MISKMKKWLGIEGVKIELILPEDFNIARAKFNGTLRFISLNEQEVTSVTVLLKEKYFRGRGDEKLIDEFTIGQINFEQTFKVPAGEVIEIDFVLPFEPLESRIDRFEKRNIAYKALSKIAKKINAVHSEYWVVAEATVKDVALKPFAKKQLTTK